MTYFTENSIVYLDGKFVRAVDAKTDLYSQSLHYGYAVFEGIRSYRTVSGTTRIFRATAHFERLQASARALNMPFDYTVEALTRATYQLLEKNDLQDAYIRPLVYGPANMSFAQNTESYLVIQAWKMAPFLGDKLLRVMTSSFQRPNPKGFHIEAKAAGHYVNSILASQEAKAAGYDEALLTDINGCIAEGPGANVFFEKDGRLFTPAKGNILPGITRATVLDICRAHQVPVEEKLFTSADIQDADAAFFCGTAAEVIGWESLDNRPFLKPWNDSISRSIQRWYAETVVEKEPVAEMAQAQYI